MPSPSPLLAAVIESKTLCRSLRPTRQPSWLTPRPPGARAEGGNGVTFTVFEDALDAVHAENEWNSVAGREWQVFEGKAGNMRRGHHMRPSKHLASRRGLACASRTFHWVCGHGRRWRLPQFPEAIDAMKEVQLVVPTPRRHSGRS